MKTHKWKRVLMLLVVICLIAGTVPTLAQASTKSLTIRMSTEEAGVVLQAYKIADNTQTGYKYTKEFEGVGVDLSKLEYAEEKESAINKYISYIEENKIRGRKEAATRDGIVKFTALEEGLYLVVQASAYSEVSIQPLLLTWPTTNEEEIKLEPKISRLKGAVILNKLGDKKNRLQGAVFQLQQKVYYTKQSELLKGTETGKDENGKFYWKVYKKNIVTNAKGQAVVENLSFGAYRFIETKAPDKYKLDPTPHEFTINAVGTVTTSLGFYKVEKGKVAEVTVVNQYNPKVTKPPFSEHDVPEDDVPAGDVPDEEIPGEGLVIENPEVPQTNDDTPIGFWVAVFAVACGIVVLGIILKKREKNEEE